jgi:ketosteroid isomerase-like protein
LAEQDLLELARKGMAAWSRGDLDGMLETMDERIEFHTSGAFPDLDPVYHGHEGVSKFWNDIRAPWRSLEIDIEQLHQSGDRIVALYNFKAVGRDGLAVSREAANVLIVRDGLALRIDAHATWDSALRAIGLAGQLRES